METGSFVWQTEARTKNVHEFLKKNYRHEVRISYKKLKSNGGISVNTNKAMELARGEYLMLCDHDDTLEPDALFEIVKAINDQDADANLHR